MPTRRLPDNPHLEHLRNQAKTLQRRVRDGDGEALGQVREFHPRPGGTFGRSDALLVIARSYGFASWPALHRTVDAIARFTRSPHRDTSGGFLVLACLTYSNDDPQRWAAARRMLAERPELAGESIFTAAAVGDVAAARRWLDGDPGLANRQGGPHRWEPLLYLAYSRVDSTAPGHSTLEVARLLLERGADPAAGFLWDGLTSPFTVLTGAFGGGEGAPPPHQFRLELAELLLSAGADANDSQTLYNCGLQPDGDEHLRLLLRHGLGRGDGGVWPRRLGPTHPTPAQLLQDELIKAVQHDRADRVRLLLDHGADPDGVGTAHPVFGGHSARELSTMYGHGYFVVDDPVLRFLGACMRADEDAIDADFTAAAIARRPQHLITAAALGRTAAVRLMAGLGFDVHLMRRGTALHEAAFEGHLDTVRALVELGADPDLEDPSFHATPRGWAEHGGHRQTADYLASVERSRPS